MSSEDTPKTILLRGSNTPHSERVCAEADILPGHLLDVDSSGRFRPHASAAGKASPVIAREASYVGRDIDTNYEQYETVPAWHGRPGDWFYMILEDGHNVSIGAVLESAGDGTLQPVTGNFGLFRALEAVNTSGGATATSRIKVEVL